MKFYNDNQQFNKVLQLFDDYKKNNKTPTFSSITITQALKACTQLRDIQYGKSIHRLVSERVQEDYYIFSSLIHMYMQCGDMTNAETLFAKITNKTLPVYGAMMKGYLKNNQAQKAIDLFSTIEKPGEVTVNLFFNACAQLGTHEALDLVKNVLKQIPKSFHGNSYIRPSLIDASMKCKNIKYAESVFNRITGKTLAMYGAMIKGYVSNNEARKAIELFNEVKQPDEILFNVLFNACAQLRTDEALNTIYRILKQMPKPFHSNPLVVTSLVDALMKCGDTNRAESIFGQATNKTQSMYGAMMKGYIENNQVNQAINLFKEIKNPNDVILIILFNGCARLKTKEALDLTRKVSRQMPTSCDSNSRLITSLLDALMKCGDIQQAEKIFHTSRIKVSAMYGAMMKGYIENNDAKKAIDLFYKIKQHDAIVFNLVFSACTRLESSEKSYLIETILKQMPVSYYSNPLLVTSLLNALMSCNDVDQAEAIFNQSVNKTLSMYGALMKGYIRKNEAEKAIGLFEQVNDPDEIVLNLLFNACAQDRTSKALSLVQNMFQKMPKSFHSNLLLITSLLDALMKCGDVNQAQSIFDQSKNKTLPMYGAMMKGFVFNELPSKAIDLFDKIHEPDEINFTIFFNACGLLGTNVELNRMKDALNRMPESFLSNDYLVHSLIDSLMNCGDTQCAEAYFHKATKKTLSMYVIMMNGYNNNEFPSKTLHLFDQMIDHDLERDNVTYLRLIKALSMIGDYSTAQSYVTNVPHEFFGNKFISSALIDMWGRVGKVDHAKQVFEQVRDKDSCVYTTMINSYGLNGCGSEAVDLYRKMSRQSVSEVTNICVLNACSHSRLVDEARTIFENISIKTERIYSAMIDCLCRASYFEEAQFLIDEHERSNPPFLTMYMAMLSGARNVRNVDLSEKIHDRMKKLFPKSTESLTAATVLLANTYGSAGESVKAAALREHLHQSDVKKKIGASWTTINGQVFKFQAHDVAHPRSAEIYSETKKISKELVEHGHVYDSS